MIESNEVSQINIQTGDIRSDDLENKPIDESNSENLKTIINSCQSAIKLNKDILEFKNHDYSSSITLEKIASDMSNILSGLKTGLNKLKDKSIAKKYDDIQKNLEQDFQRRMSANNTSVQKNNKSPKHSPIKRKRSSSIHRVQTNQNITVDQTTKTVAPPLVKINKSVSNNTIQKKSAVINPIYTNIINKSTSITNKNAQKNSGKQAVGKKPPINKSNNFKTLPKPTGNYYKSFKNVCSKVNSGLCNAQSKTISNTSSRTSNKQSHDRLSKTNLNPPAMKRSNSGRNYFVPPSIKRNSLMNQRNSNIRSNSGSHRNLVTNQRPTYYNPSIIVTPLPLVRNDSYVRKNSVYVKPDSDEDVAKVPPNTNQNVVVLKKSSTSTSNNSNSSSVIQAKTTNLNRVNVLSRSSTNSVNSRTYSRRSFVEKDVITILREEVNDAMRNRKTFTIQGNFPAIRRALLGRGWVERIHQSAFRYSIFDSIRQFRTFALTELISLARDPNITKSIRMLIKSKLLMGHQVDLYWGTNDGVFKENPDKTKLTLINRFKRGIFSYTSKQGLCESAGLSYWYRIPGVSNINHPRTYLLSKGGDTKGFIDDFHLTAAMSLLKFLLRVGESHESLIISESGKIPLSVFDFAIHECYKFIKRAKHEDIDIDINDALDHDWNEYLANYYKMVHIGNHFKKTGKATPESLLQKANFILKKLKKYCHNLDMDGYMNIWILKPVNSSQGQGIHICRTLNYILKVIKDNPNRRYVIQKYIERPLLIYSTKFDIRQWFLISSSVPLTIWMYKDCYLRFSSQTYNLRKLHESIHLTNNSVQCKYHTKTNDIALPPYNMWDSDQFKNYLSNIGYPKAFRDIIYPGMKQSITAAVLMHQDSLDTRKNCFELYGADFMLTEDFIPWLLEINSNPALHASTPVTSRMCPRVLEDVIKVMVDHSRNNKAGTGQFELIYKEKITTATNNKPPTTGLKLVGKPLTAEYFNITQSMEDLACDMVEQKSTVSLIGPESAEFEEAKTNLIKVTEGMKDTLHNLLELVKHEKIRRENLHNKSIEVIVPKNEAEIEVS